MRPCLRLLLAAFLLLPAALYAQSATGVLPFATFNFSRFDQVNVANVNVHFAIKLGGRPGRGASFSFGRTYDSSIWTYSAGRWYPNSEYTNPGWQPTAQSVTGSITTASTYSTCKDGNPNSYYTAEQYSYVDPGGAEHAFAYEVITDADSTDPTCPAIGPTNGSTTAQTTDDSGYTISVNPLNWHPVVYDKRGNLHDSCYAKSASGACESEVIDTNGNRINSVISSDGATTQWFDSLSGTTPVLTIYAPSGGPVTYSFPNAQGGTSVFTEKYTTSAYATSLGCQVTGGPWPEYSGSLAVPTELDLPNGQLYKFAYDRNARISSVTLPTGSVIQYTYGAMSCVDDQPLSLTRQVDSQPVWQYSRSVASNQPTTVTVTDPLNNQTAYTFSGMYKSTENIYQGSTSGGKLLRTIQTCYNGAASPCSSSLTLPITQESVLTTLDNGKQSRVDALFDASANVKERDEYDFGAATPTRKTVITWTATDPSGNFALPTDIKVTDGAGTTVESETKITYDEGTPVASGITTQLTTPTVPRGNPTTVQRLVGGSTWLTEKRTYYDTGKLATDTDPNQNTTSYFYDAAYAGAWLTEIQRPSTGSVQHVVRFTYDPATGLMSSSTDENGNVTRYAYADPMDRLTQITEPAVPLNGGAAVSPVTTLRYSDQVGSLYAEVQKTIDTSRSTDQFTYFDGLGRPVTTCAANDEATPWDRVDTVYDNDGRISARSYPYQAANCTGANTEPGETFAYDALGRTTTVTHSDGSQINYNYLGAATEVQDEGNHLNSGGQVDQRVTRILQRDGLGRLVSVCEVTGQTGAGTNSTPSACSNQIAGFAQDIAATGFETGYSYDLLSNLTKVQQPGIEDRTFSYNSLGRLLTAFNPEAGTTSYSYDGDGNVLTRTRPAPNQSDPNTTVITTYSYDALNRLLSKTYADGTTPSASFAYDQTSAGGVSLADTVGRLSYESSGSTGAAFSYDALGRILGNSQCTPHNCGSGMFPITYTYDLLGDPTQVINGVGVGINQAWNRAQRLTGVTSSLVDSQHPATLLSNVHYGPFGPVSGTLGGVAESRGYTARGWLNSLQTGSLWSLNLGYQPDGTVASANDSGNGSWTYGYDSLNRLQTANCNSNCPGQAAGAALDLGWNYDRYGSRWSQAVTAGTAPTPSAPFTGGNNRMDGWSYDAAGNLLYDGAHHYSYDAESRLISVDGGATASYVYDAEGRRVRRTAGTFVHDLLYDLDGHVMTEMEYDSHFNGWSRGEIYAGGRHLASYMDSTTYFDHGDGLGTERLRTRMDGSLYETCVSLPFGDVQNCTFPNGAGTDSPLHFTGKPRDSETGLDDFGFRYNSSTLGRWMTPDPAGNLVASPANPQSWNQYAYVMNNPTTWTDPNGLDPGDNQFQRPAGEGCLNDPYGEDPKIFDACGGFAGFAGGGAAWNVFQIDPFSLIGIPVATDESFISPQLISQINWSSIANQNGYATSAGIYTPLLWGSVFVGKAFALYSGPLDSGYIPSMPSGPSVIPESGQSSSHFFFPFPPLSGVHYCGPGAAGGTPKDGVDAACQAHDRCYDQAGLAWYDTVESWVGLLPPAQKMAKSSCDQTLCAGLPRIATQTRAENGEAFFVGAAFGCVP